MGNKIFISYKYWDFNVSSVPRFSDNKPKARDYVSWLEDKFKNRTEHYFKGESDNEDLSDRSDDYIWSKLKDKIYDSSITIVLISPGMKDPYKHEKSQWIPWEISYSIKKTLREAHYSQRNAVLAVVLPDKKGSYDYYRSMRLFNILKRNITNGYIPVVIWDDFKYDCDRYIQKAYNMQRDVTESQLSISI
ncbi:MAG: hypothetical protein H6Q69_3775 [Firmicutes bacterium]|nr:hypothetical protein [Bacillota bacterium]